MTRAVPIFTERMCCVALYARRDANVQVQKHNRLWREIHDSFIPLARLPLL
jgi:hypothetical protein